MKQSLTNPVRRLTGGHGASLVVLALLGMLMVMPGWASAQSDTTTTFTSPLPGPHHGQHGGLNDELRELLDSIVDRDAILADVLGLTEEELAAAREAGVSIPALIEQAGLDKETVRTEIQTAVTEAVQQAVADGAITQEQADAILNLSAPSQGHEAQGHGGHGGRDGERRPPHDDNRGTATPAPTVEATTTTEPTTAEPTTTTTNAATEATVDGAATPEPEQRRPRHEHGGPTQNSDVHTSAADTAASDTANDQVTTDNASADSTSEEAATTEAQSAAASQNRDESHRHPGR